MMKSPMRTVQRKLSGTPGGMAVDSGPALTRWFWVFLFAAVLLRAFARGVAYWPVLDDNNMYGIFSQMGVFDVPRAYPDFFLTRPAAVAFDVLCLSRLWGVQWVALALMAACQCLFLLLFHRAFERLGIPVGAFALVFLALDPFGMEATYWIAASSRVLMGCLFACLSLYILIPLLGRDGREPRHPVARGIAFAVVNLLSFGFYEQCLMLSLFLCGCAILFFARGAGRRLWLLVPLANVLLIGGYYAVNAGRGNMAQRGGLVRTQILHHVRMVVESSWRRMVPGHATFTLDTARAGLDIALREQMWVLPAFILLAGGIAWFSASRRPTGRGHELRPLLLKLLAGLALLIVPLGPFFLLENSYMANRNYYPSMIGIALLLDLLPEVLAPRRRWNAVSRLCVLMMGVFFLFGSLSEVRDYQAVSQSDARIVASYARAVAQAEADMGKADKVVLFNTRERYPKLAVPHFANCTAVDWALQGAVGARAERGMARPTVLVRDKGLLPKDLSLSDCLLLGIDEAGDIVRLRMADAGQKDMGVLVDAAGKVFGTLAAQDEGMRFQRP